MANEDEIPKYIQRAMAGAEKLNAKQAEVMPALRETVQAASAAENEIATLMRRIEILRQHVVMRKGGVQALGSLLFNLRDQPAPVDTQT